MVPRQISSSLSEDHGVDGFVNSFGFKIQIREGALGGGSPGASLVDFAHATSMPPQVVGMATAEVLRSKLFCSGDLQLAQHFAQRLQHDALTKEDHTRAQAAHIS